jgi:hypothetical protein
LIGGPGRNGIGPVSRFPWFFDGSASGVADTAFGVTVVSTVRTVRTVLLQIPNTTSGSRG